MMDVSSISDIVNLWPDRATLAADLRELGHSEVQAGRVHKWAENCSIPSRYQHALLQAARARGFQLTADRLVELHAALRTAA